MTDCRQPDIKFSRGLMIAFVVLAPFYITILWILS